MNLLDSAVAKLDQFTRRHRPSPGDTRHLIGSWAAMSVLQFFLIERIAVISWIQPDGGSQVNYSYFKYFVSDLGAHQCRTQDPDSSYARWICSPLFALMDLSLMILGIGVILASLLITASVLRVAGHHHTLAAEEDKPKATGPSDHLRALGHHIVGEHYGRKISRYHLIAFLFRLFLFVAGWGLVLLGGNPEDFDSTWHSRSTALFLCCAVLALITLGYLWWPPSHIVSLAIILCAAMSIIGGGTLIYTDWRGLPDIQRGLFERLIVYGFIAGVAIMGAKLAASASSARRATQGSTATGPGPRQGRPSREELVAQRDALNAQIDAVS